MNEHQVRDHVRKLRRFYTDALIYVVVNVGLIFIWAISGGGYFWPIWVIISWGIGLGVHAFSLGLIPQMNAMVPFMTAEWEDQEVRRLMEAGYKGKEKADEKARKKAEKPIVKVESIAVKEAVMVKHPRASRGKSLAVKEAVMVKHPRKPKVVKTKAQPVNTARGEGPKKTKV
ncbi:MAG: 2TM domain-containing protein [Alphaproteobacteria bacterium]|nr:2TM domain-containing protein [Alphaproteobacteria bacterium]